MKYISSQISLWFAFTYRKENTFIKIFNYIVKGNIKPLLVYFNNKIVTRAHLASLTALLWFSQNVVLIALLHNQKLFTCWIGLPLPFHNIKCRGNHAFFKVKWVFFICENVFVPVTFFPVTSLVSQTFASLALVLRAHFAICRYVFTVGFQ